MRPSGVHHFGLVARDLDASLAWCRDHLGLALGARWEVPDAGLRFAHLAAAGVRFESMEREGAAPGPDERREVFGAPETRGPKHVALACDDVAAAGTAFEAAGVEVIFGPNEVPQVGVRNLFVRDPDGHQVEFVGVVA